MPHGSFSNAFFTVMRRVTGLCIVGLATTTMAFGDIIPFGGLRTISGLEASNALHEAVDFDFDGDLDIVVVSNSDEIAWLETTVGGTPRHLIDDAVATLSNFEIADIDRDGDLDIVYITRDGELGWFEKQGLAPAFTFVKHVVRSDATGGSSVAVADFEGDGDLDIAYADAVLVRIMVSDASTDPATPSFTVDVQTSRSGFNSLSAVDIDRDGDLDLAGGAFSSGEIGWFEYLVSEDPELIYHSVRVVPGGEGVTRVAVGDLDANGYLDLVGLDFDDSRLHIEFQTSLGFVNSSSTTNSLDGPTDVEINDVDQDGDLDLVITNFGSSKVIWRDNQGDGTFVDHSLVDSSAGGPIDISTSDFDGDGDLDVLVSLLVAGKMAWVENVEIHSSVTFGAPMEVLNGDLKSSQILTGDFDRDGKLEIISGNSNSGAVYLFDNLEGTWISTTLFNSTDLMVGGLASADFDQDGDLDVFMGPSDSAPPRQPIFLRNDGDGVFSVEILNFSPLNPNSQLRTADIDRDGDIDVLTTWPNTFRVIYYRNNGNGQFGLNGLFSTNPGTLAAAVDVADLDNDGDLDLIVAHNQGVTYAENDGNGAFSDLASVNHQGFRPSNIGSVDLDRDGDIDGVFGSHFSNGSPFWARNDDATLFPQVDLPTGLELGPSHVTIADVDRDGDADLGFSETGSNPGRIGWFQQHPGLSFESLISLQVTDPAEAPFLEVTGDGWPDRLVTGVTGIHVLPNLHYQASLETTAGFEVTPVAGDTVHLLTVEATHLGRVADVAAALRELALDFVSPGGAPLDDSEVQGLIVHLQVWLDDGDGAWDSDTDTHLRSVAPSASTLFSLEGDSGALIAGDSTRRFFVVARLQPSAGSAGTTEFRLVHRTDGNGAISTLIHAQADLLLEQPPTPSFTGPTVSVEAPPGSIFSDGFESGNLSAWSSSQP